MKKLLLLLLLIPFMTFGQDFVYGEIPKKNSKGDSYLTKSKTLIKAGDKITINKPIDDSGNFFTYLTQGGQPVVRALEGKVVEISNFQTFKQVAFQGKVYLSIKGFGLIPVLIDYEKALETKEISNSKEPLSKSQALLKLKEAKEMLELGVISQDEYNKLLDELKPILKN